MRVGDISKYAFAFVVQNQSSSVVLLPPGKVTAVDFSVEREDAWNSPLNPRMPPIASRTTMTAKVSGSGISDFIVTQVFGPRAIRPTPWSIYADHGEIFDARGTGRTNKGLDVAFRIWVPDVDLMDLLFGQEIPDILAKPMSPSSGRLFASAPSNALAAPSMRALE